MVVSRDPDSFKILPFLKKWIIEGLVPGMIDILTIACAFQCSYLLSYPGNNNLFISEKALFILFTGTLPFWLFILFLLKTAEIPTKHYKLQFLVYLNSAMVILLLVIIFCLLFGLYPVSRLFKIILPFSGFCFLFIVRFLKYKFHINSGIKGYNHINTIIAAEDSSLPIIENLLSKKGLGYKVVVIFTESALIKDYYEKTAIILPEKYLGILKDLIEVDLIDEVLYLKNNMVPSEIREIVKTCEELGVTLRLRNDSQKISLSSGLMTNIADGKYLSFINMRYNSFSFAIKKTLAINLAIILIFILFPVFIIIGILIKMTSSGPVISKELTVGYRGHPFYLYRFRTNVINAGQADTDPEFKIKADGQESGLIQDSSFTSTGKFLRKSGLCELPQLFNVLKGNIPISHILNMDKEKLTDKTIN